MEQLVKEMPSNSGRWISLHDKNITSIVCNENSVQFYFDEFTLVDGDNVTYTKGGYIELSDCNADEFSCYIIRRKTSPKGAKSYGKPIFLKELADMISEKDKSIELFLELYECNYFHWRGEFFPYDKKHRLSDLVIIETMDFFPMTYYWEE